MNKQGFINHKSMSKAVIFFITVFFISAGVCDAAVSSSSNYKLHTEVADEGGASGSSSSYSSEASVGSSFSTASAAGSDFKIFSGAVTTFNKIPNVSISSHDEGSLTEDNTPTLEWSYTDKDDDPQRAYQVQVSTDNFVTYAVDSELTESDSKAFTTPTLPGGSPGTVFRWRVRVSDGFDYSGWTVASNGFRITTPTVEIPIIWARVSPAGSDVPSSLWQECATPYMYWEYPASGVEITGYSYSWGSLPDDQVDTTGVSYQTPGELLQDGVRVFNLKAQNTAGNWGETASFEMWIDRGAPFVGGYSPSNGTLVSTDVPTVSISVSDDNSGVNPDGIVMKVNKSSVAASYDEGSQSVIYIPSIPLSEGDNVISLEVSDYVGNATSPLVWSFVVDSVGPSGDIIINNQDALTNSIYVNLDFTANDATTGVDLMSISNDGVFDTELWETFSTKKDNWVLPAISGTRKVYVKFRDSAGNESEIFSDTIELVIIAPDTIITSGPSLITKSTEALFTFKATTDSCVFRWKFDDAEWSEWGSQGSSSQINLSEGNHYFKVQAAKDVNNNQTIDADEMDPVPEERTWTIGDKGELKPDGPKKKPFRFWKEE